MLSDLGKRLTMKSVFLLFFVGMYGSVWAQVTAIPFTADGKLLFTEVVPADSATDDLLYENAKAYFLEHKKKRRGLRQEKTNKKISRTYTCVLYQKGIATQKPYADIQYKVMVEVKDHRYRYQFTDFTFQPYVKTRYGKMEPLKRKTQPLGKVVREHKDWGAHEAAFLTAISQHIAQLKTALTTQATAPDSAKTPMVQLSDEW